MSENYNPNFFLSSSPRRDLRPARAIPTQLHAHTPDRAKQNDGSGIAGRACVLPCQPRRPCQPCPLVPFCTSTVINGFLGAQPTGRPAIPLCAPAAHAQLVRHGERHPLLSDLEKRPLVFILPGNTLLGVQLYELPYFEKEQVDAHNELNYRCGIRGSRS